MSGDLPKVNVDIGDRSVPLEKLVQRYERGEYLHAPEIGALVEYPRTGVDVAEWRRLKAKLLFAGPQTKGDKAAEQAAVEHLRGILQDHDVETVSDYTALLKEVDEDHPVQRALTRLSEVVTPFEERREPSLLERMEEREKQPAAELYRPPDAGEEWDPAMDQELHEFIATVEDSADVEDPLQDVLQGDTWTELKEQAQFDPEEWGLDESDSDAGER